MSKYITKKGKLQHRTAVEKFIGRKLKKTEVIHHLNHNRSDNRISNLMIFSTQKDHKSFENKERQFGMTNNLKNQIKNRWKKYTKDGAEDAENCLIQRLDIDKSAMIATKQIK